MFPDRIDKEGLFEIPKTLIFAKTDSHAEDIIDIVREEFAGGNQFPSFTERGFDRGLDRTVATTVL